MAISIEHSGFDLCVARKVHVIFAQQKLKLLLLEVLLLEAATIAIVCACDANSYSSR